MIPHIAFIQTSRCVVSTIFEHGICPNCKRVVTCNDDTIIPWEFPGIKPFNHVPVVDKKRFEPNSLKDIAVRSLVGNLQEDQYDLQSLFAIYDSIIHDPNLYGLRLPILRTICKYYKMEEILQSDHFKFTDNVCYFDIIFYHLAYNGTQLQSLGILVEYIHATRIPLGYDVETWVSVANYDKVLKWATLKKYERLKQICFNIKNSQ